MKQNKLVTYDYEGASISFQNGENVMVNATEMARVFNKKVNDWLRLPSTIEYLSAIETAGFSRRLVETKEGRNGGTWLHRNVALEFARWLSPMFSIWCNDRILELMQNGYTEIPSHPKRQVSEARINATMTYIERASALLSLDAVTKHRLTNDFAKEYGLPLIDYTPSKGNRDSMTNLLKKFKVSMSANAVNKRLAEIGILETRSRNKSNGKIAKFYVVTEKGKQYGDNFQSEHSPKQTQPLWFEDSFNNLIDLI